MSGNILCPVALNHKSSWQPVLPVAIELTRTRGATLHLVTVIPKLKSSLGLPSGPDYGEDVLALDEYNKKMKKAMEQEMEVFIEEHFPDDLHVARTVATGHVDRCVLEVASRIRAQLIVMSGYSPSLRSFLLGTSAERIMRHAKCSVYIVRP
ncbi:universal stress protein [Halomonas sp. PR-M31]|uniref:universal stress protein n=1 Tax=Halomonas sp. PR-M31 TaxID=1471202 RepID=UPI0006525B6C|nr:universal stress protein [Halomonas sp. PR-M31]